MAFTLENVVPWGRSYAEYLRMFALTTRCLEKTILGCGDGPAGFNARMHQAGRSVVSADPLYRFSAEAIEGRICATYREILVQLEENRDAYHWDEVTSPAELGQLRMDAMREFLADYPPGREAGRYQPCELPTLPFKDRHFDLALCSHLLFLYSGQFSLEFHLQALRELCRVASEVRIFPLVTLAGDSSPYLDPVLAALREAGHGVAIEVVPYEFQRGGNRMLRITPHA